MRVSSMVDQVLSICCCQWIVYCDVRFKYKLNIKLGSDGNEQQKEKKTREEEETK
jgi:hypothetical protein